MFPTLVRICVGFAQIKKRTLTSYRLYALFLLACRSAVRSPMV